MKKINSKTVKITKDTSEILKQYHQDIRNIKIIPKEEELQLFNLYKKNKSPEIKDKLIRNNLRFVLNVSKHYHNSDFYELSDVISSGNIGLIRAVEEFDPSRGFQFSTYAIYWIKQSILDGIAKESKMIKQPIKAHTTNQKYIKAKNKFYNEYGFDPSIDDIRDDIGEETASEILAKSMNAIDDNNVLSISTVINSSEELNFEDILPTTIMNEEFIYAFSDINSLSLEKLNKVQKIILSYKYGFNNKPELSFSQISEILQLQEKEVKNIHDNALRTIYNDL